MGTLDPHAAHVLSLMAASGQPTLDELPPPQARQAADIGIGALQGPPPPVAETRDVQATGPGGPIPLRLYRPQGSVAGTPLPALVYIHGGGFVIGNIGLYDVLCRRVANAAGCAVVSVEYRLAPEAKFPAAAEDAFAALQWIAAHAGELGIDATRLAVGGDSAGGNLATVTALMAREHGGPALALQVLIYPATDLHGGTASCHQFAEGHFLTGSLMQYFISHYLGTPADADDWRASPLLAADHAGLPPAFVMVGGFDPLRDEGIAYAKKLEAAGVPVLFRNFEGQIHGFLSMDGAIPEAATAIDEIAATLRTAFGEDTAAAA